MSADANGDHCFKPAVFHKCADGQDHETTDERGVAGTGWHVLGLEVDGSVRSSGVTDLESERWVGHDWKSYVGAGASSDESGSNGVDSIQAHWSTKDVGYWDLANCTTGSRLVKSLGDKDGASCGKISLAGDVGGGTKVSGKSNTLNDGSQGDEFLGFGHWEAIGARFAGLGSSSGETSLEVEKMTFLVMCDIFELIVEAG